MLKIEIEDGQAAVIPALLEFASHVAIMPVDAYTVLVQFQPHLGNDSEVVFNPDMTI